MCVTDFTDREFVTKVAGVEARPGWSLIGTDGRDWSWAYVVFREAEGQPGHALGTDGSFWTRWKGNQKKWAMTDRWRRRRPTVNSGDRLQISFSRPQFHQKLLHVAILETFVGPCPPGLEGCHRNDKPRDNRLANLRWDTHEANIEDAIRNGRIRRGDRHPIAKLTEKDIALLIRMRLDGASHKEIGNALGISGFWAGEIIRRGSWGNTVIPDAAIKATAKPKPRRRSERRATMTSKPVHVTKAQKEMVWRIYSGKPTAGMTTSGRKHQILQALFAKGYIDANDNLTPAGIGYAQRMR